MLEDYESNLLVEVKFQTSVSNHLKKRFAFLFMVWPPARKFDVDPCFELNRTHEVQKKH